MTSGPFAKAERLLAAGQTYEGVEVLGNLTRANPDDPALRARVMLRIGDARRDTHEPRLATSMWSSAAQCVLMYQVEGPITEELVSRLRGPLALESSMPSLEVLAWASLHHAKELLDDTEFDEHVDAFMLAVQVAFSRVVPEGEESTDAAERILQEAALFCGGRGHHELATKWMTRAAELAYLRDAPVERRRELFAAARALCDVADPSGYAPSLDRALQRITQ